MTEHEQRQRRMAENEAAFRSHNEAIATAIGTTGTTEHRFSFMCECAHPECGTMVELSLADYAEVREDAARFFVAPEHDETEVEVVVDRRDGYWIVEKVGAGREVAERTAEG